MRALYLILLLGALNNAVFQSRAFDSRVFGDPHQQELSLITIDCHVRIEDAEGFSFDRLRVQATYTRDKRVAGPPTGPLTPDQSGHVVFSVPAGCWVDISVSSYDPTLRHLSADGDDWYSLGKDRVEVMGGREFYVPPDSLGDLNYSILLLRGAAFSLCVPSELKSGMVLFRRPFVRDRWHVITFNDASSIEGTVVGGLEPGPIKLIYADKRGRRLASHSIRLQRGIISSTPCT